MNRILPLETAVLIVVMATSFLTPFMGSAVNLSIPAIAAEFGDNALLLGWMVTGYLLTSAVFLLPFGRYADIVGRKKVFIAGTVLFSLFAALSGLAWSLTSLIWFRAAQGIASAMIFSTGMAILTTVYPAPKRGKAMGLTAAVVYIGLAAGPVLGGVMNHYLGWRSIFHFTAIIGILAALLAIWRLEGEWAGARGETFDFIGSTGYILALSAVLYGFSSISSVIWAKYILVAGLALMALFLHHQSRQQHPILQVELFRQNKVFAYSNLAAMINYSATFAVGFLISLHLQLVMGYDSQMAGLILLSQPVLMAALSPFAGTLSDRISPSILASWGMGITALGLFLFVFISVDTYLGLIIANLALIGVGFALFASPNNNAIMSAVEKKLYGVASSSLGTMRLVGQAVSMAVVTLLIASFVGDAGLNKNSAPMIVAASRASFMVFTAICIIGVFASLARGSKERSAPDDAKGQQD
ncbi:MFS transporter [Acetonema longum]|uniref:Major facilitator transporter n=1 Tax=Acetonema longum DSM 6540 TaxID=1009370 RepID=F7NGV6_9FIRM|nr:MFS transporter [Acetonema longum]EGO64687.1 major facilitator transporter [Acetonema longum DSM 6540]